MPPTRQVSNTTRREHRERREREQMSNSRTVLANHQLCVPEADSLCVCCSCGVCCVCPLMACFSYSCILQHTCAIGGDQCGGVLQSLTDEEWRVVRGRCIIDDRCTYDSTVICKHHVDELLHWYKPKRCAACPRPLSASANMQCPEWMREQLHAHHGTFVHIRPCYKEAVAVKKQQAANTLPVEVKQENEQPKQTFQINVRQHKRNTYNTFDAGTRTQKYVFPLLVCAGRLGWRRTLGTICIRRLRISAD